MIGEGSNRGREEESKRERQRDEFRKVTPVDTEELRRREAGYKKTTLVQVEMNEFELR